MAWSYWSMSIGNVGLVKPSLGHEWVITSLIKQPVWLLLIHIIITVKTSQKKSPLGVMKCSVHTICTRHNGLDGVSNHQPYDYLLSRLFRRRSKKTSKLRVTGLQVCGEFTGGPVNFPHKWPVTRKMFPFDDVIMVYLPTTSPVKPSWMLNDLDFIFWKRNTPRAQPSFAPSFRRVKQSSHVWNSLTNSTLCPYPENLLKINSLIFP